MASAQPAVRIDSLEKRYASGTLALKGVSFDVEEGEFCAYVAEDGTPCRNHARPGSRFCGVHADCE